MRAILTPLLCIFILAGCTPTDTTVNVQSDSSVSASTSSSTSTATMETGNTTYDPNNDPTIEGTPAYEAAEQKSKENVARAKALAETFVFRSIPDNFVEYCPPHAGFCFSHPASWGTPTWNIVTECINRDDLIGFAGSFKNQKNTDLNYFFGATALSYAARGECEMSGRGGSILDGVSYEGADTTVVSESGEEIALWYGNPVGWLTHDFKMVFAAPTGHSLVKHINFVGPRSSSPDLTEEEIHDFLTVAHSYKAVPVQ